MGKIFSIESLAGGAIAEQINGALEKVLENISDLNTPYKTKRKLNISLVFNSDKSREMSDISITIKPTLAPATATETRILIDRDNKGRIVGAEYKKQIPGQMEMKLECDEEGEVINDPEAKTQDLKGLQLVK
ncbi:replication terminator protein [Clostridium estertheticum]|uniref:replication terminator protein n=1 Tax=Clostridium estertheticum TaxID=238834 RepID=UPI001C0E4AFE|nr:replication terminator protein [Clostridium estertheticum]MBU3171375.1 replication terminator protein [Clostridium estertheticum]MBU3185637.1 replication terminator protein [Clostridium estertheticum]